MHVYLGLTRSNNVLNLNTESLLQIFCGIKNNTISNHMKQRRKNRSKPQHQILPGKAYCSKPLYHILYIPQGIMKQLQTKLFSQELSVHQLIVSHCHTKISKFLNQFTVSRQLSLLTQFLMNAIFNHKEFQPSSTELSIMGILWCFNYTWVAC